MTKPLWMAVAVLLLFGLERASAQQSREPSQWPLPVIQLPAELDRVLRDYEAAWRAGDGAALAKVFTADGLALPNGQLPRRGAAAIRVWHTRPGGDLQLVAFAYATSDTVGYLVGGYRYPGTKGPGGKFVLALRRDGNRVWRIAADIENGSGVPPS